MIREQTIQKSLIGNKVLAINIYKWTISTYIIGKLKVENAIIVL